MSRFAILRHDSPRGLHWDLLLQMGEALKTWALPQPPESGEEITCEALPDHRLAYLDYEGPVSGDPVSGDPVSGDPVSGDPVSRDPVSRDRGTVTRWDRGTYQIQRQSDSELVVELAGEKLIGQAALTRWPEDPKRWKFSFDARAGKGAQTPSPNPGTT